MVRALRAAAALAAAGVAAFAAAEFDFLTEVRFDEANRNRLAVSYYAERGWNLSSTMLVGAGPGGGPYESNIALAHTRYLNCSIALLRQNMGETPMDFLVFVPAETLERDGPPPEWLRRPDVKVVLTEVPRKDDWWGGGGDNKYIQMGAWRLAQQFKHVRAFGYQYMLQTDDDALVDEVVQGNVVELMREGHHLMGGYCRQCFEENGGISGGGAALMRFFVEAYGFTPTGPVLAHCEPAGLEGLVAWNETTRTGWRPMNLAGNWNLFDIDFWFGDDVQRFIRLVLASDLVRRRRWNELMPETMVAELFVPDDRFLDIFSGKAAHHSFLGGLPPQCDAPLGITRDMAVNNTL